PTTRHARATPGSPEARRPESGGPPLDRLQVGYLALPPVYRLRPVLPIADLSALPGRASRLKTAISTDSERRSPPARGAYWSLCPRRGPESAPTRWPPAAG